MNKKTFTYISFIHSRDTRNIQGSDFNKILPQIKYFCDGKYNVFLVSNTAGIIKRVNYGYIKILNGEIVKNRVFFNALK